MFYSQIILAKKGPLGKIWIAAHWDKKLNKAQIFQTNINTSVENILQPTVPLALRMSGHLLLGLVRIYSRKVKYLMSDASEALVKIQMAFRPGATDMPTGATVAAPGAIEAQGFGEFDELGMDGVHVDVFSNAFAVDNWMEEAPANLARRTDITLTDPAENMSSISGQDRNGSFMLGESSMDFSPFGGGGGAAGGGAGSESRMSMGRSSRVSRVSDIEAVRDGDNSRLRSGHLSMSMDVMAADEGQMDGGYDDLGPPTHPNELADIGGGRELDDAAEMMDIGNDDGGGFEEPEVDAPEFNPDMEEDLGQGGEGEEELPGAVQLDDDTLDLDDAGFSRSELPPVGGVEGAEDQSDGEQQEEDHEPVVKPKATRTRKRKLVLDQVTLIDMATMKAQLQDTSDITRKRWRGPRRIAQESLTPEEQLAAPLMPWLAPPIQDMLRACMHPGGFPFPVRMRAPAAGEGGDGGGGGAAGTQGQEDVGAEEEEEQEEAEVMGADPTVDGNAHQHQQDHDDVEVTRRADDSRHSMGAGGLMDTSLGSAFKDNAAAGLEMDRPGEGEGGDIDAFDLGGDGDGMDVGHDGGMEDFGDGGFEADLNDDLAPDMQDGGGDLDLGGGVNDLEASRDLDNDSVNVNDNDNNQNADQDQDQGENDKDKETSALEGAGAGGDAAETGALPRHKWHPHTVKVLRLVQKQLKAPTGPGVTHASLTRGATRRTAAGAFFELLQLKTWDFVELSQQESYGDIQVTAGPRLGDKVQAANV